MLSLLRILKKIPLVRRIALSGLLCAASLSALALLVTYSIKFNAAADQVAECLSTRLDEYFSGLGESIWLNDKSAVLSVFSNIESKCQNVAGDTLPFYWSLATKEDENWLASGNNLLKRPYLESVFPISYWKNGGLGQYGIGELSVTVSLRPVYSRLVLEGWLIYITLFLIMALSCVLAMFLGYRWFFERSHNFIQNALKGDIDESYRKSVENERTEMTGLWGVILGLRSDFEQQLHHAQRDLHQIKFEKSAAESDLASKNQMVARLSHELRTPMNGLISFVSLLSETSLDQDQKEYVQTIQASLESLLYVINDVSDLVRFESGELQVDNLPFCIRSVMSGISSLLRSKAESKGLAIETRVDPAVASCLLGDPGRVRKLLSNLVFNAIEYTQDGRILVNVDVVSDLGSRSILRLSVEDSGIPLDLRWSPSFEENEGGSFRQTDVVFDNNNRLAKLLGSEIQYRSIENSSGCSEGVSAWLDLEFVVANSKNNSSIDRSALDEVQLLIVDNSELSRKLTLELVGEWGVPFVVQETVVDALKVVPKCIAERYTIVLLDDSIDGYEAATAVAQFRSLLGGQGSIVVTSASPSIGDGDLYFNSGAGAYLVRSDKDLFLKDIICQVYAERDISISRNRRLITRHTVGNESDIGHVSSDLAQRALLVEGNIVNQQFLARELEKRGCLVDVATNGFEAVELFKHHAYDLIIMDCWMEDMDGYETAQLLRDLEVSRQADKSVPIVALVNNDKPSERERCKKVGMNDFLSKPVKLSHLEMVLRQYLD